MSREMSVMMIWRKIRSVPVTSLQSAPASGARWGALLTKGPSRSCSTGRPDGAAGCCSVVVCCVTLSGSGRFGWHHRVTVVMPFAG
jgi:hypothetical protein